MNTLTHIYISTNIFILSISRSKLYTMATFRSALMCYGIIISIVQLTIRPAIALKEDDCPVCFSVVDRLRHEVTKNGGKPTVDNVSNAFLDMCDLSEKGSTDSKFCYYLGGQEVSATRTYKDMAERMAWGLPTAKVCEHLRSRDSQICEIRERKKIDLKTVDLRKLKIVDMKRLLKDRGEVCDGCFEKSEFIAKLEAIKAREEL